MRARQLRACLINESPGLEIEKTAASLGKGAEENERVCALLSGE